jgi:hypothetical protein
MQGEIELIINEKNEHFLTYWDWKHGNDICCQLIDGKLLKDEYDENSNELPPKEITLSEFIELIKQAIAFE